MNIKNIFSLLFISLLMLTSCKKELEPQESSSTEALPPTENAAAVTPGQVPAENQNMEVTPAQMQQAAQPQQAQPAQVAAGMNPAHGQPGHRCDIAVGAPLNSPAGKPTPTPAPAITPTPAAGAATITPMNVSNPAPAVATLPGMNPPHGQEGHRCDVSVGAPLPKA